MRSKIEQAWAAGFFDGEGCTTLTTFRYQPKDKNRQARLSASLRMSVAQIDRVTLERFMLAVGVGAVRGPYQYKGNRQPHFQWNASAMDVFATLDVLWPYLGEIKRAQAMKRIDEYEKYLIAYPPRVNQFDKRGSVI